MGHVSARFCRSKNFHRHILLSSWAAKVPVAAKSSYWEPGNTTLGVMGPSWVLLSIFFFSFSSSSSPFPPTRPPDLPQLLPPLPHLFLFRSRSGVLASSVSPFVCCLFCFVIPPPRLPSIAAAVANCGTVTDAANFCINHGNNGLVANPASHNCEGSTCSTEADKTECCAAAAGARKAQKAQKAQKAHSFMKLTHEAHSLTHEAPSHMKLPHS